jgi:hypothetical protein
MSQIILQRVAGWSALINAFVGITGFVALMLFFTLGGLWGSINDSLSVIWALSLIPLAWLFVQANRLVNPRLGTLATLVGIGATLFFAVLQGLLVVGVVRFEQTLGAVLTLTGVIGLWLLISGLLARAGQTLPLGLVWAMLAFGVGLLFSAVGFWLGGEEYPLTAIGFLVGVVTGFVWAAWLARLLLSGRLPVPAQTQGG